MSDEKQQSDPPPAQGGLSRFVGNVIKAVTVGGVALRVGYSFFRRIRQGRQDAPTISQSEEGDSMDIAEVEGGGDERVQPTDSVAAHGTGEEDLGAMKDESKTGELVSGRSEGEKRKIGIISARGPEAKKEGADVIKRQRVEMKTTENDEGKVTDDSQVGAVEVHRDVGQILSIHGIDPDGSHVVWFAISPKDTDGRNNNKLHVRFLHEVTLDQEPLLYCAKQQDIDAVRSHIAQTSGVRYFVHPAGGRFLKPFRVKGVSRESVSIPRAHYKILHTWEETKKTDGPNHLFAVHITDDEVARLREILGVNEANDAKQADYTHEFVGERVVCIFTPGYTARGNETPLDIARKHKVDVNVIIDANKEKCPGLQVDTPFQDGHIVVTGPKKTIFGKVVARYPADGDNKVDLWRVLHNDGDDEDLELHEVQDAMLRYKQIQAKPVAEPVNLSRQPSAHQPPVVPVQKDRAFAPPYSSWSFRSKRRTTGTHEGKVDVIIIPPGGPRISSKVGIIKWRDENGGVLQVPLTNDVIDKMWRAAKLAVDFPGVPPVVTSN